MMQFIESLDLMLSHVLLLHLCDPVASSEPALTSSGLMERGIWHFHCLGPGHSDKHLCHMPCAWQGRASITQQWPHMGHTSSTVYRKHQHRAWN